MQITIVNRNKAIKMCHSYHGEKAAMISISTPFEEYHSAPFITPYIESIFRIEFHDIDKPAPKMIHYNTILAKKMAQYVVQQRTNGIEHFIIHCDAGVSRSAGVGAALYDVFAIPNTVFETTTYSPNMLCYRNTYNAICQYIRNMSIVLLREQGMTYEQIGSQMGVSRERIRQILVENSYKKRYISNITLKQLTDIFPGVKII